MMNTPMWTILYYTILNCAVLYVLPVTYLTNATLLPILFHNDDAIMTSSSTNAFLPAFLVPWRVASIKN